MYLIVLLRFSVFGLRSHKRESGREREHVYSNGMALSKRCDDILPNFKGSAIVANITSQVDLCSHEGYVLFFLSQFSFL